MLFGHPTDGYSVPVDPKQPRINGSHYEPVGSSMSFFKYHNKYYLDTFFIGEGWADSEGKREHLATLNNHLAVFLRSDDRTQEVCEYYYDDKSTQFETEDANN